MLFPTFSLKKEMIVKIAHPRKLLEQMIARTPITNVLVKMKHKKVTSEHNNVLTQDTNKMLFLFFIFTKI